MIPVVKDRILSESEAVRVDIPTVLPPSSVLPPRLGYTSPIIVLLADRVAHLFNDDSLSRLQWRNEEVG